MSTDLQLYLGTISAWASATDDDINSAITDHQQFIAVANFDSDDAINTEFDTLVKLADTVRDLTVAEDALKIAADAAAVSAIWTFGFGMVAFVVLDALAWADGKLISKFSGDLNAKMTTIDTDISANISPEVKAYIATYKANNDLIMAQAQKGVDTRQARSYLMQFMAQVEHLTSKPMDLAGFKKYAQSADYVYNSDEIQAVYKALDTLNFSDGTTADVQACMGTIKGLDWPYAEYLQFVQGIALTVMYRKLNIARKDIEDAAAEVGDVDVSPSAFGMMDVVGKFAAVIVVATSIADAVLDIMDIVDVVEQTQAMCDKLNGDIKQSYKDFFDGISTASQAYNAAIATPPSKA